MNTTRRTELTGKTQTKSFASPGFECKKAALSLDESAREMGGMGQLCKREREDQQRNERVGLNLETDLYHSAIYGGKSQLFPTER